MIYRRWAVYYLLVSFSKQKALSRHLEALPPACCTHSKFPFSKKYTVKCTEGVEHTRKGRGMNFHQSQLILICRKIAKTGIVYFREEMTNIPVITKFNRNAERQYLASLLHGIKEKGLLCEAKGENWDEEIFFYTVSPLDWLSLVTNNHRVSRIQEESSAIPLNQLLPDIGYQT